MNWKALAIVLLILLILETGFVIWAYNLGTEAINNEAECSINICYEYDAYHYDDIEKVCYCYEGDEIAYQEFIK